MNANLNIFSKENASQKDKQDMLTELHVMKCLKFHNHVVQMIGYSTRSGEYMLLVPATTSRTFSKIQIIARNSDCFISLFVPVVIGRSKYFGIGFSTVI